MKRKRSTPEVEAPPRPKKKGLKGKRGKALEEVEEPASAEPLTSTPRKGLKKRRKASKRPEDEESDSPAEYVPSEKNMAKIESMLKQAEEEETQETGKKGKKKTLKDLIAKKKELRKEKRKERQSREKGRPLTSKEKLKLKLKNIKEHSLKRSQASQKTEKSQHHKSTPCMYVKQGRLCPHDRCRFAHDL
ncbi:Rhodanese-like domain-containing protein 8 [Durusdinium trenchii]